MATARPIHRFSLLSLVLLVTAVAALAGWIAALRQANLARRETLVLRREVERFRAELGDLQVVDTTRVHAIGLRRAPAEKRRWKWRVYLPTAFDSHLVVQTDRTQSIDLPASGEVVIEAQLSSRGGDAWQLDLAIDGAPVATAAVPWFVEDTVLSYRALVRPNDRSVWEQAERPVLIEATNAINGDDDARFAIWIERDEPSTRAP
jgi:hypothetical protein